MRNLRLSSFRLCVPHRAGNLSSLFQYPPRNAGSCDRLTVEYSLAQPALNRREIFPDGSRRTLCDHCNSFRLQSLHIIQFENLSFRPRPIAHVVLDLGDNVLARDPFVRETVRIARDGTRPRLGPARSGLLRRTLTLVDRATVSFALPQ